ncbi:MAG: ASPIC/UnbV domain-containing protein, partial [Rhodopirellula sp. JB053]
VMPTRSYLSQCEKTVTFGLGSSEEADSITITWPGGSAEQFDIEKVDQTVLLTQGEGTVVTDSQ